MKPKVTQSDELVTITLPESVLLSLVAESLKGRDLFPAATERARKAIKIIEQSGSFENKLLKKSN